MDDYINLTEYRLFINKTISLTLDGGIILNDIHLHLLINHVPVLLALFSLPVLIWGLVKKNESFITLSLIGFIVAGILILAVYQTGEWAEELAENIPGISEESMESHEDAGKISWWLTGILGLLGIGGLTLKKLNYKHINRVLWGIVLYSAVSIGWLMYTANSGGEIRHTEITDTAVISSGETDDD